MDTAQIDLPKARPRDRWYQVSILEMLLCTVMLATLLGFWRILRLDEARREAEAAAVIAARGGSVEYDYVSDRSCLARGASRLLALVSAHPDPGQRRVVRVSLSLPAGGEQLKWLWPELKSLRYLKCLDIRHSALEDRDMAPLIRTVPSSLEELCLDSPSIGDLGLGQLRSLKALRRLELRCPRVSDSGLGQLQSLKALRSLELHCPRVGDKGLMQLVPLGNLDQITLGWTSVSVEGMSRFQKAAGNGVQFQEPDSW
jgi:hypothetical protein